MKKMPSKFEHLISLLRNMKEHEKHNLVQKILHKKITNFKVVQYLQQQDSSKPAKK